MNTNYYTVDEIALKLEVHSKTIRRYIYSGKISAKKIGGQWRIYQENLDEYISSTSTCCTTPSNENISQDDFCVFMDNHSFSSNSKIQLCIIVDLFIDEKKEIKEITGEIMDALNECDTDESTNRYNYVFDKSESKARFVLWGSPTFMEIVTNKLKRFEK